MGPLRLQPYLNPYLQSHTQPAAQPTDIVSHEKVKCHTNEHISGAFQLEGPDPEYFPDPHPDSHLEPEPDS